MLSLQRVWLDDRGQDAAEYALLMTFLLCLFLLGMDALRSALRNGLQEASDILNSSEK